MRMIVVINLAVAAMGPFGSLATVVQIVAMNRQHTVGKANGLDLVEDVQDDDIAARLYEKIVQNRAYRGGALPKSFQSVMAYGTVPERQAVLAEIVRSDREYPEDLLASGLKSRDIAVRASAGRKPFSWNKWN